MNRLKSIFVSFATLFWAAVLLGVLYKGLADGVWYPGVLVSVFFPFVFFVRLFTYKSLETSRHSFFITGLILIGILWSFYQYFTGKDNLPESLITVFSLVLWLIYIYWYSLFPFRFSTALKDGHKLPVLSFTDQEGNPVSTTDFKGKKLIYLFYRGNWCPLCMAQIKEVSKHYRELHKLGAEVLLISPQPHKFTINLAKKMDVPFQFLCDDDNQVARQLGIDAPGGTPFGIEVLGYDTDTVLPTVIITDERGKIIYSDQSDNYRVRPEPQAFIEAIENYKPNP